MKLLDAHTTVATPREATEQLRAWVGARSAWKGIRATEQELDR